MKEKYKTIILIKYIYIYKVYCLLKPFFLSSLKNLNRKILLSGLDWKNKMILIHLENWQSGTTAVSHCLFHYVHWLVSPRRVEINTFFLKMSSSLWGFRWKVQVHGTDIVLYIIWIQPVMFFKFLNLTLYSFP